MRSIRNIPILLFTLLLMVGTSCQKEKQEFIDETNEEETITLDSVLTGMLLSASQNDGYKDNIIDGSSCISVRLPVTVVVNEQKLIISDEQDFGLIQAIFDEFANDIDILEIIFPIRVVFEGFNEVEVGSQAALTSIIDNCQNDIDDTYTCVDFEYPISCFIYNNVSEETGFVTLNSSEEWFAYLNYIQDDIYISINYPMGVLIDGTTTMVSNNQELTSSITSAQCDLSGNVIDPIAFVNKLTSASWFINLYDNDGLDETCNYSSFEFTFSTSGTITAAGATETRNGYWNLSEYEGTLSLMLEFELTGGNDPFEVLNEDWSVLESNTQTIKLKDPKGGNNTMDHLYFGRSPATNCGIGVGQQLIDTLIQGEWIVASYSKDGNNQTSAYGSFTLDYQSGGVVSATAGVYTYYGSWSVLGSEELEVQLDFGTQIPLNEFNATWDVTSFDSEQVTLFNIANGHATLIFEKI